MTRKRLITSCLIAAAGIVLLAGLLVWLFEPGHPSWDKVRGRIWEGPSRSKEHPGFFRLGGTVIVDASVFEILWKNYYSEPVPKVNFQKSFIVVGVGGGWGQTRLVLERVGSDLRVKEEYHGGSFPGQSWMIREVDREGIETINGVPLEKEIVKQLVKP